MSLREVVECLKKGKVAAIPTDTVFGLFADIEAREAIKRIFQIKKRPLEKPLVLMVGSLEEAKRVAVFNEDAEKLAKNFWPGPITLVLKAAPQAPDLLVKDGKIGIRIPDHKLLLEILKNFKGLASTSANISREPPLVTYREVQETLGDKVDCIYSEDAYGKAASTVIEVAEGKPRILRKGPITILQIEKLLGKEVLLAHDVILHILFVCTGNTCRSPMAEFILKKLLPPQIKSHVAALSAGTSALRGEPVSPDTERVLKEIGIDAKGHRAKPLNKELVEWADLIYCMEKKHIEVVKELGGENKALWFSGEEGFEIPDPIGQGFLFYRLIRDKIKNIIESQIIPYLQRKWDFENG